MKRSDALIKAQKKYHQSEKGRAALKRALIKHRQTKKGKATYRRANKKFYKKQRDIINEAKADGCIYCGETELMCLDFHHRDPEQKEFGISRGVLRGKDLLKEIAKCDVVCANCHRKLHAGLL